MVIQIKTVDNNFKDWSALLKLLQRSYAFMDGRIDPPSSLHSFDADKLAEKSRDETLLLACEDNKLMGCIFGKAIDKTTFDTTTFYVGKLAVDPAMQGKGLGRRLMTAMEEIAKNKGEHKLQLETRIELVENHATFQAMGWKITKEGQHEGYDRTTYIVMEKDL